MARNRGWVRRFHEPPSVSCPQLLIFPHAGSGASAYRDFSKTLSTAFEVLIFQYPGRQDRAAEPALTSLPEIAAGAFDEFAASEHRRDTPLAAFGHSMGGLVAFEFVRIAEARGIPVRRLNVSAAVAPSRVAAKPPHPTADEDILRHLAALEGTGSAVFASPELMRMALPAIKADYRAFDAYDCPEDARVAAPVRVLGGDQDPFVPLADLYGWNRHSASVDLTMFSGGHFYFHDHVEMVSNLLATEDRTGHLA
ncbi:alpha/beta fold hydrolase [Mycolicibacillus trivialis]|uniref:Thioesterase TesA n=1 Tax=Mycolicibacillus trivialis TaxID=1798 RepID=A0A1X2ENS0_9MYCO|nr:alpha/beta fold hydrolase [Mycolicibacillus trivialis]ORX07311.1 thioesterase [Mycolicibacillus trivialis]